MRKIVLMLSLSILGSSAFANFDFLGSLDSKLKSKVESDLCIYRIRKKIFDEATGNASAYTEFGIKIYSVSKYSFDKEGNVAVVPFSYNYVANNVVHKKRAYFMINMTENNECSVSDINGYGIIANESDNTDESDAAWKKFNKE